MDKINQSSLATLKENSFQPINKTVWYYCRTGKGILPIQSSTYIYITDHKLRLGWRWLTER